MVRRSTSRTRIDPLPLNLWFGLFYKRQGEYPSFHPFGYARGHTGRIDSVSTTRSSRRARPSATGRDSLLLGLAERDAVFRSGCGQGLRLLFHGQVSAKTPQGMVLRRQDGRQPASLRHHRSRGDSPFPRRVLCASPHRTPPPRTMGHISVATAGGIWNCTLPNGL